MHLREFLLFIFRNNLRGIETGDKYDARSVSGWPFMEFPGRSLCEAEKVKPGLPWRPQHFEHNRVRYLPEELLRGSVFHPELKAG